MHTSLSKKLLAGLLSLVMVLSLVAPSISTEAASKYSLTKKTGTTATAGVSNTYYVKGVKKTQYIKVTGKASGVVVKKGTKTLKTTTKVYGTGKTITLKVTAPDKVANYKNKLTVKVYNKKTNKVVKTLTKTTTIKVKALEIASVEAATYENTIGGAPNVKYLNVKFNKALDSLDASEVAIRDALTEQLFTVSKVELAKNGKSAVITLLGNDEASAGGTNYLSTLTDYVLKVTQNSVTASINFTIPAYGTGVVNGIDPVNKKIFVNGQTLYVTDANFDYFDMLGRDVFVKYNKDQEITNITAANYKTVYGSIWGSKKANADGSVTFNMADGSKYNTQPTTVSNSNIATLGYEYADGLVGYTGGFTLDASDPVEAYTYAKIILNANGTIRRMISYANYNDAVVESVKGNYVTVKNGTINPDEKNFKDYVVVKNNKLASLSDIVAGDYIMYSTTKHYVIVATNKKEVSVDKAYTDRVVLGGETYSIGTTNVDITKSQVRIDDVNVATDATYTTDAKALEHGFEVLKAGGNVTIYFDTFGDVAYIHGTAGAVTTNTKPYVVVGDFKTYKTHNTFYVYATLSNGTDTIKLDIPLSQLNKVGKNTTAPATAVNRYTVHDADSTLEDGVDYGVAGGNGIADLALSSDTTTSVYDLNDLKNKLINVVTNKDGNVIELREIEAIPTKQDVKTLTGGEDLSKNPGLGTYVTTTETPVFLYDAANKKVTTTTLGEISGKIKTTPAPTSYVIANMETGTVKYLVLYKADLEISVNKIATHKTVLVLDAVIKTDITLGTASNEYITELKVVEAGKDPSDEKNVETYTLFDAPEDGKNTPAEKKVDLTELVAGNVIELGLAADGKTVVATANSTDYNKNLATSGAGDIGSTKLQKADSTTITFNTTKYVKNSATSVYEKKSDGTFTLITWDELVNYANAAKIKTFDFSKYQNNDAGVLGVVVITTSVSRVGMTEAMDDARTLIDALTTQLDYTGSKAHGDHASEAAWKQAIEEAVKTQIRNVAGLESAIVTFTHTGTFASPNTPAADDTVVYAVTVSLNGYSNTFGPKTVTLT